MIDLNYGTTRFSRRKSIMKIISSIIAVATLSGCAVFGYDSNTKQVTYSGGESGLYCSGSVGNSNYCSLDSRKILEVIGVGKEEKKENLFEQFN